MVETITPAGCGSRQRYRVALALFSVGAIAAAAALGALLGVVGEQLDRSWTLPVLAVLALLAALREWGVLRVPVPGAHRQVPERWRREWPLGAWSLAYGAGLGAGIFTHQVVATFWVACAGAVAIGDPAWSAACLALFGAGRALMVALPARGGRDPSVAVGRLAQRARALRPANAGVLVALAALAAATPAVAQAATPQGRFDPAVAGKVLAVTEIGPSGSTVIVRAPGRPDVRVPGSRTPALDFDLLAYTDGAGINVIRWTTGEQIARVAGDVRPGGHRLAPDRLRAPHRVGRAPGDAQPGERPPRHGVARGTAGRHRAAGAARRLRGLAPGVRPALPGAGASRATGDARR